MNGLRAITAAWIVTVIGVPVWHTLLGAAELIGLQDLAAILATVAAIVTSLTIIAIAARRAWRWCRRAGQAVTTILDLPDQLHAHQAENAEAWADNAVRLERGNQRMARIEQQIDALRQRPEGAS